MSDFEFRQAGTASHRPSLFWHGLLVGLLLAVAVGFFYFRHQLVSRAERDAAAIESFLDPVAERRSKNRNLERWHDSSLVWAAIDQFRAARGGNLPTHWSDSFLPDRASFLAANDTTVTIMPVSDDRRPAIDLPVEGRFHVWPGFTCRAEARRDYLGQTASLSYDRVIARAGGFSFAIVYWAEDAKRTETGAGAIKCLDSLGGYDQPDFIFDQMGGPA